MTFAENLAALPETQGKRLRLLDEQGVEKAVIENAPGTAGSFRVYAALAAKHGPIDAAAAEEGLVIYAEHTEDARLNPGKHPNIDRLFEVIKTGAALRVAVE
ncbi:DUF2322 family protein [Betaproteobacteria bacterium SCN2]|nr:DUF2322 family protein [Betaproteobacteria bacterium SCN2]